MLQREVTDTKVAAMFYIAVVQVVLLFVLESWILSAAMEKTVEGAHTGFLRQVMGKQARQMTSGLWVVLDP